MLPSWYNLFTRQLQDESWTAAYLRGIKSLGFSGIQLDVTVYTDETGRVFAVTQQDIDRDPLLAGSWNYTAPDYTITTMLRLAEAEGLSTEVRIQLDPTDRRRAAGVWEGAVGPRSASQATGWFAAYTALLTHYVDLAEAGHAKYFCPLVENDLVETYTDEVSKMLAALDARFSGTLLVAEATNNMLIFQRERGGVHYGSFWSYDDMLIGMDFWQYRFETSKDQHLSVLTEGINRFWSPAVEHYRSSFPDHEIVFSEAGTVGSNGIFTLGTDDPFPSDERTAVRDDQEVADFWAAVLLNMKALGVSGVAVWAFEICYPHARNLGGGLDENPARFVIQAALGG
jgi:hypothetical protein